MKLLTDIKEMQHFSTNAKRSGKSIVFVPTMGYLHDGHASLLAKGRELGDILVMSIFVNPTQFGPKEDYAAYPRDLDKDLRLAEAYKVDVVFNPPREEMYPEGFQTYVDVERLSNHLCGLSRPGHFRGVATVVVKLFNVVRPDIAIFGEKDYQQLLVIKRVVKDLNMGIDVVCMPTIREEDGLAMSSRNGYLNERERKAALCLHQAVMKGQDMCGSGIIDADTILKEVRNIIEAEPLAVVDYIKLCDSETLEDLNRVGDKALLVLAVKIGKTRLIDNIILSNV